LALLNTDLPVPKTTGFTMMRSSSIKPICMKARRQIGAAQDSDLLAGLLLERRKVFGGIDELRVGSLGAIERS
jgi:hypothetical protein